MPEWETVKLTFFYTLPESVQELWLVDLVNWIQSTPNNSNRLEKSEKGSSYQKVEANKQNRGGNVSIVHFHNRYWIWTGVTREVKTRNWQSCFEINSVFWTSVQWYTVYFSDMSYVQNMFEVIKGKILLYTIVPEKRKVGAYITIFPACLVPVSGWLLLVCVMKTWILLKVSEKFSPL